MDNCWYVQAHIEAIARINRIDGRRLEAVSQLAVNKGLEAPELTFSTEMRVDALKRFFQQPYEASAHLLYIRSLQERTFETLVGLALGVQNETSLMQKIRSLRDVSPYAIRAAFEAEQHYNGEVDFITFAKMYSPELVTLQRYGYDAYHDLQLRDVDPRTRMLASIIRQYNFASAARDQFQTI